MLYWFSPVVPVFEAAGGPALIESLLNLTI